MPAPHVHGEVIAPLVKRPQPLGHPQVAKMAETAPPRDDGVDDQWVRKSEVQRYHGGELVLAEDGARLRQGREGGAFLQRGLLIHINKH